MTCKIPDDLNKESSNLVTNAIRAERKTAYCRENPGHEEESKSASSTIMLAEIKSADLQAEVGRAYQQRQNASHAEKKRWDSTYVIREIAQQLALSKKQLNKQWDRIIQKLTSEKFGLYMLKNYSISVRVVSYDRESIVLYLNDKPRPYLRGSFIRALNEQII